MTHLHSLARHFGGTMLLIAMLLCMGLSPAAIGTPQDDAPIFLIQKDTGGTALRGSGPTGGVVVALWKDGTVLLSANPERAGTAYVTGEIGAEAVTDFLARVKATGFLKIQPFQGAKHMGTIDIAVQLDGAKHAHAWHGTLLPSLNHSYNTDPSYRASVRAWKEVYGLALALTPESITLLDEKATFRGFDPAKPLDTPWMLYGYWRENR